MLRQSFLDVILFTGFRLLCCLSWIKGDDSRIRYVCLNTFSNTFCKDTLIEINSHFLNSVGFAVGTGRCGTKFMSRVAALEPKVASTHERAPFNEAFHRYCQWYNLPVDTLGFLAAKREEIETDLETHAYSFEASAHLSLSIEALYKAFGARFVLLVRSPEKVVNSYIRKGWYSQKAIRNNSDLALGYQNYCEEPHHFLGRIMPSGDRFDTWNQMSRVGKLAWYWNILNLRVLEQFAELPKEHYLVEKLENFSYERYLEIADFLGYASSVSKDSYESLSERRPNRSRANLQSVDAWNDAEISEFEAEVRPMAERLEYEYRVSRLIA